MFLTSRDLTLKDPNFVHKVCRFRVKLRRANLKQVNYVFN